MLECHCPTHRRSRVVQALDEGKRRATLEQRDTARLAELDKQRLELRSHVLTLREGELDSRRRDRTVEELNRRLRELTATLRKEQATRESLLQRLATPAPQILARRKPSSGQTKSHNTPQTKEKANCPTRRPSGNQHARYAEAPEEEKEVHGAQAQMRYLSLSPRSADASFRMRSDKGRKR